MTKEHRAFVVAHEAHNPPGGGCIIYCTGKYEIGNPHSHRWNAGKQAKAEKRVPYNDYNLWKSQKINLEGWQPKHVARLAAEGGFSGTPTATASCCQTAMARCCSTRCSTLPAMTMSRSTR